MADGQLGATSWNNDSALWNIVVGCCIGISGHLIPADHCSIKRVIRDEPTVSDGLAFPSLSQRTWGPSNLYQEILFHNSQLQYTTVWSVKDTVSAELLEAFEVLEQCYVRARHVEHRQALKCTKKQNVGEKMLLDAGQPARLGGPFQNPLEPCVFLIQHRISIDDSKIFKRGESGLALTEVKQSMFGITWVMFDSRRAGLCYWLAKAACFRDFSWPGSSTIPLKINAVEVGFGPWSRYELPSKMFVRYITWSHHVACILEWIWFRLSDCIGWSLVHHFVTWVFDYY